MHSKAKPPTKAEERRWVECGIRVGCIACRQLPGTPYNPPDQHHLLSGGRRRGHAFTVPLCIWHHRGQHIFPAGDADHERVYGPSLARNSRAFRARFGTDDQLLAMTEDWLRRSA